MLGSLAFGQAYFGGEQIEQIAAPLTVTYVRLPLSSRYATVSPTPSTVAGTKGTG